MTISLRLSVGIACFVVLLYVIYLIRKSRIQLRYSLPWLAIVLLFLICSLFPQPVFYLAGFFGFKTASNFIFFIGFIFLLVLNLFLTTVVSKQDEAIKNLSQAIAINENRNQ